jgi:hypothetical protein
MIFFNRSHPAGARSIFFSIDRSPPLLLTAWREIFFPVASCMTGCFLCRARKFFFFLLAAAQQRQCAPPFLFFFSLSDHFHSLRARRIFYLVTIWSQLACKCQGAMQYPLCSSVHARTDFFVLSGQQLLRMKKKISFSSSRFLQLRAQFFFCHTLLQCAQPFALVTSRCVTRAARKLFFCHFRAAV